MTGLINLVYQGWSLIGASRISAMAFRTVLLKCLMASLSALRQYRHIDRNDVNARAELGEPQPAADGQNRYGAQNQPLGSRVDAPIGGASLFRHLLFSSGFLRRWLPVPFAFPQDVGLRIAFPDRR